MDHVINYETAEKTVDPFYGHSVCAILDWLLNVQIGMFTNITHCLICICFMWHPHSERLHDMIACCNALITNFCFITFIAPYCVTEHMYVCMCAVIYAMYLS